MFLRYWPSPSIFITDCCGMALIGGVVLFLYLLPGS